MLYSLPKDRMAAQLEAWCFVRSQIPAIHAVHIPSLPVQRTCPVEQLYVESLKMLRPVTVISESESSGHSELPLWTDTVTVAEDLDVGSYLQAYLAARG